MATFIIFSHDTMTPEQASREADRVFFDSFDYDTLETNTIFQGETSKVMIKPLPSGARVLGNGDKWSIMVICMFF